MSILRGAFCIIYQIKTFDKYNTISKPFSQIFQWK